MASFEKVYKQQLKNIKWHIQNIDIQKQEGIKEEPMTKQPSQPWLPVQIAVPLFSFIIFVPNVATTGVSRLSKNKLQFSRIHSTEFSCYKISADYGFLENLPALVAK